MTTTRRCQHSISLTEPEQDIMDALQLEGIGYMQVFRDGLALHAPKVPKELTERLKAIVK